MALDDPLRALGLPLVQHLLDALGERPEHATAVAVDLGDAGSHWSCVLRFPSGLRATVDLGDGLGAALDADLDLRIEWSGTERVVLCDPGRVSVTVRGRSGTNRSSAEATPLHDGDGDVCRGAAAWSTVDAVPAEWRDAFAAVEAIRVSARDDSPVQLT